MQHILYFLDKNSICSGQLLFCEKMQAGPWDKVPKSSRRGKSYQTHLQKTGNTGGDQARIRCNKHWDFGRQGWIRSYGRHRDRRGKNGQKNFFLYFCSWPSKISLIFFFQELQVLLLKTTQKLLIKWIVVFETNVLMKKEKCGFLA